MSILKEQMLYSLVQFIFPHSIPSAMLMFDQLMMITLLHKYKFANFIENLCMDLQRGHPYSWHELFQECDSQFRIHAKLSIF